MDVRFKDLGSHLARTLAPIYLVHGDEPLFATEAGDAIRAAARKAGATERDVLVADAAFDWDAFVAASANMGLFAERRLVDLRIPSGKPGADGAKSLEAYAANPHPDDVLLVTMPRLDRTAQSAPWFAALAGAGAVVAVYPLDRDELPAWIAMRLSRQKQRASADSLSFLAERCEGNLLAARQEIEKLALLLPEGELAQADIERAVADVARYDVFELSEAWLGGEPARALRVLASLRAEGEGLPLIVWQLTEDVHALAGVLAATAAGVPMQAAVRNARVWGKRASALERAARRVKPEAVGPLLASLARLDALSKGLGVGSPWDDLATIALALAGTPAHGN
jgi:DNA polymerase-3 subunit delta